MLAIKVFMVVLLVSSPAMAGYFCKERVIRVCPDGINCKLVVVCD
jgi:hypothetical protein